MSYDFDLNATRLLGSVEKLNEPTMLYPMEIRCAWCNTHMRWGACVKPDKISHGICPECRKEVNQEIEEFVNNKKLEV